MNKVKLIEMDAADRHSLVIVFSTTFSGVQIDIDLDTHACTNKYTHKTDTHTHRQTLVSSLFSKHVCITVL